MKTIFFALVLFCALRCSAASSGVASNTSDDSDRVVPLPPVLVDEYSSNLGFACDATVKAGRITLLRFSRVDPGSLAQRAGLEPGDRLVDIDGHPIVGMDLARLQALFARDLKPGETLVWNLTVERGSVFARRHTCALRLKTKAVLTDLPVPSVR